MLQDNQFMTALNSVRVSTEMNHWVDHFHDHEILFASNYTDAYVGAQSMVEGMGLSWPAQYHSHTATQTDRCGTELNPEHGSVMEPKAAIVTTPSLLH